jgi:hypothetical protein
MKSKELIFQVVFAVSAVVLCVGVLAALDASERLDPAIDLIYRVPRAELQQTIEEYHGVLRIEHGALWREKACETATSHCGFFRMLVPISNACRYCIDESASCDSFRNTIARDAEI